MIDSGDAADVSVSAFVVTRTASPQLQEYYGLRSNVTSSQDGACQVFYALSHFPTETTVSIASAALLDEPTGVPRCHNAEVIAAAGCALRAPRRCRGPSNRTRS